MTTLHLLAAAVILTAFLVSSAAELFISHYVDSIDRRLVVPMIIVKGSLILLSALVFVYDVSDFDQGSIAWFMPIIIAGVYLTLCFGTIWQTLQPDTALSRAARA
jgi:hypothetical protein